MGRKLYKNTKTFDERMAESMRIKDKYPGRIPVIAENSQNKDDLPEIDKIKYLVPDDITVGQFIFVIRKRMHLSPEKAMYIFVENTIPPISSLMSSVYKDHKDADGFLYFTLFSESTFG